MEQEEPRKKRQATEEAKAEILKTKSSNDAAVAAKYQLMSWRKLLMLAYKLLMGALMFLKHG